MRYEWKYLSEAHDTIYASTDTCFYFNFIVEDFYEWECERDDRD